MNGAFSSGRTKSNQAHARQRFYNPAHYRRSLPLGDPTIHVQPHVYGRQSRRTPSPTPTAQTGTSKKTQDRSQYRAAHTSLYRKNNCGPTGKRPKRQRERQPTGVNSARTKARQSPEGTHPSNRTGHPTATPNDARQSHTGHLQATYADKTVCAGNGVDSARKRGHVAPHKGGTGGRKLDDRNNGCTLKRPSADRQMSQYEPAQATKPPRSHPAAAGAQPETVPMETQPGLEVKH